MNDDEYRIEDENAPVGDASIGVGEDEKGGFISLTMVNPKGRIRIRVGIGPKEAKGLADALYRLAEECE